MNKKTYPILKKDYIGFIFTVISIFITVRLGAFNGFNFGYTLGVCAVILTSFIYLFNKECKDKIFSFLLLIGALVLAAGYSVTSDSLIKILSFWYILFICATMFATISGNSNAQSGTYTYFFNTIQKSINAVFDNFTLPFRSTKESGIIYA